VAHQFNEIPRIFYGTTPEGDKKASDEKQKTEGLQEAEEKGNESENEQFCRCKGQFKSFTGYFVGCEGADECINGGWLHPECTTDLRLYSEEQINKIDTWYCEDCVARLSLKKKKSSSRNRSSSKKAAAAKVEP